MKKKILLIFCFAFMFLIGFGSVSAKELICEYDSDDWTFSDDPDTSYDVLGFSLIFDNDGTIIETQNSDKEYKIDIEYDGKCPEKLYYDGIVPFTTCDNCSYTSVTRQPLEDNDTEFYLIRSYSNKVDCGSGEGMVTNIPKKIPELTSFAITVIQIAIPVILVILGSLDLFKGITAGKEDEMKKGQQIFIKRLVVAAIIFFVVIIVKFLISVIADTNETNIIDCIDCFIDNDCEEM